MPRVNESLWLPSLAMPMSAGRNAAHTRPCRVEHFGGGKARIDFDTSALGFGASQRQTLPSEPMSSDDCFISGGIEVRQPDRGARRHPEEAVVLHRCLQRTVGVLAPVRDQSVGDTGSITAPDRLCAPTSEPFSTTTMLRSALELLQPDRSRQARRPRRRR